jgi:leucyl/phenylalanyl-tRNA--protein transferase
VPTIVLPGQRFPDPREADDDGLVAVTTELTPDRIIEAYARGVFPWFERRGLVAWFSPDPRMVLEPETLHVGRTLRKTLARGTFDIRLDTAFREVIVRCARTPRRHEHGTWIGPRFIDAYAELHRQGLAHSAEAWQKGRLVGGLYGVSLGGVFFGESMFATVPDASKAAFATLVIQLQEWGFRLIDCQVYSRHLASLGATEWPREEFLRALAPTVALPARTGPWRLEPAATAKMSGGKPKKR